MALPELLLWLRPFMTAWVFLVFTGLVAWIYWPRRRSVYDAAASIPMRDDR